MADPRDNYSIRCIEFGDVDCNWEAYGRDEDELMQKAEMHGREQHSWASFSDEAREKARNAIRKRAA